MADMVPAEKLVTMQGFENAKVIHGATYKDSSTVVIVPTRGTIHHKTVAAWQGLIAPMNQKRAFFFCAGHEVGHSYNTMIQQILADPNIGQWKYVLTLEDDNLPPPDAHVRLLESIDQFGFDAVSGIYFTKGDISMPMAYGDPERYRASGELEFRPIDPRQHLERGNVTEVNGIAMGCALWRMDLFRQIAAPWFVTVADLIPDKGVQCFTQDLYFCERAKRAGKRFGVDWRVRVGHLDVTTGLVY